MKTSYRLLSLLLIAVLILSACGRNRNRDQGTEQTEPAGEPAVVPVAAAAEATRGPAVSSTAAKIRARGKLVAGVKYDFKPFGYVNDSGAVVGFDVDIVQEFARRWLGDANAVDLIKVTSADRIQKLAAGELDLVAASMTHKRERDATIDFSQTYFLDGQSLLARENSAIRSVSDLDGKSVAAIQGSTSIDNIKREAERLKISINVVTFQEYPPALEAVKAGDVDALTTDSVALNQFAQDNPGLVVVGGRFTQEPYGIGVPQGDSDFRELVDRTLQEMKRDGSYDAIYRKWFPSDQPFEISLYPSSNAPSFQELPNAAELVTRSGIAEVLDRGRLIVGVREDRSPWSVRDGNGQLTGFDPQLAREFARRWLNDENAIDLRVVNEQDGVSQLVSGEIDLLVAALVPNWNIATRIDFSQPYHLAQPGEPVVIGVPQNDWALRELVNFTLQEIRKDRTYEGLHQQWFGTGQRMFPVEVLPGDANYLLATFSQNGKDLRISGRGQSVIERIRRRGNVMIAGVKHDFKPFGFLDPNGQVVGFDIDLMRAMAQQWGVAVQFVPVTSSDRIQKLAAGQVDIVAASMTHTKGREETIDFSQTYFLDGQSLLVRADAGINGVQDLAGRTVAAIQGSTSIDQIQAHGASNGVEIEILPFQEYIPALEALKAGQVDALTTDSVALSQFAIDNPELAVVGGLFTQEPYGFGLPSGDSYFNNLVNFTLQDLKKNGVYDQLYRKWFGDDSQPYPVEILPGSWPYTFATSPVILDKPVRSKVDLILERGKFVAGVKFDFRPFGFVDDGGNVIGFDIDIMKEFAKRWLGDANAVEFVQVTSANRIQTLAAGQVDIIAASMTHTQERDETIDFSQTYFLDGQSLLVHKDSGIDGLMKLNGRTVAAIQGSTSIDNITAAANSLGITINLLPFQEYPQSLEALRARQIDALTTDSVALSQFAQSDPNLRVVGGRFTSEPYGLGLPNYDDRFQDLVNFTLQEMRVDGTYDRIYRKWFGADTPYPVEVWPGSNYLGMHLSPMVKIPTGPFTRGYDAGFPDEKPARTINLTDFYIDQYEVTNRQYEQCVRAGQCTLPRLPRSVNFARYYAESDFGNYPVIWVSWQDADTFCRSVGKRLPTEAEWERAARGAAGSMYPWGNDEPTTQANINYVQRDVVPVGTFSRDVSPEGAYDMAGNVREWVADWYQWDYYQFSPDRDPAGPDTGVTKVLRGGGWNDSGPTLRSTVRKNFLPDSFDSNLGFRCASSTFLTAR